MIVSPEGAFYVESGFIANNVNVCSIDGSPDCLAPPGVPLDARSRSRFTDDATRHRSGEGDIVYDDSPPRHPGGSDEVF
jgi:hypothetical protein